MRLPILLLLSIASGSHILFAQEPKEEKSYSANIDKIDNIKSSYSGCIFGPCYTWWSIALRSNNEFLMQTGAHHPAGSRSRYFSIGTWTLSGDTLKLNIIESRFDATFMSTEYLKVSLYYNELLLPLDSSKNWEGFLKDIQTKFEQEDDYKEFKDFETPERIVPKLFYDFIRHKYPTIKFLIKDIKWY